MTGEAYLKAIQKIKLARQLFAEEIFARKNEKI